MNADPLHKNYMGYSTNRRFLALDALFRPRPMIVSPRVSNSWTDGRGNGGVTEATRKKTTRRRKRTYPIWRAEPSPAPTKTPEKVAAEALKAFDSTAPNIAVCFC